jgi:uncharacterized damage-inducible protein DinB
MDGGWKKGIEAQARFNETKNSQLYGILGGLTSRALHRERGSWFGSLMGLLNHIIVTDLRWLDRFRPLSPDAEALCDGRLATFPMEWKPLREDFSRLREDRVLVDTLIREWFAHYPESGYPKAFSYVDSGGNQHGTTASRAFDFLFMHQNYHRGQISQILDDLGIPHSFADNGDFLLG